MSTSKQNINGLPESCFSVLLIDQSLIGINVGDNGYKPLNVDVQAGMRLYGVKTTDELADAMNAENGVTREQRQAMQFGSQFGWHLPSANPEFWVGKL